MSEHTKLDKIRLHQKRLLRQFVRNPFLSPVLCNMPLNLYFWGHIYTLFCPLQYVYGVLCSVCCCEAVYLSSPTDFLNNFPTRRLIYSSGLILGASPYSYPQFTLHQIAGFCLIKTKTK